MDPGNVLKLARYYIHDPRLALIPIEALTPAGLKPDFATHVLREWGWSEERLRLFDAALRLYWERTAELAAHTRTWMPPRLRHIGVARDCWSIRPYVQILNTSAWLLYDSDLDPAYSTPEFLAYVLVHGDRMATTGEVTRAALRNGAYWLLRSDEECGSFVEGATRSPRPDADAFRALATALPWLRQLSHQTLRRPTLFGTHRTIPGTDLLIRNDLQTAPTAFVGNWVASATHALGQFRAKQSAAGPRQVGELCDWLATTRPRILICGRRERVLWDPDAPERISSLRNELKGASATALRDIGLDLEVVHSRTVAFYDALTDAAALPAPEHMENRGYVYLDGNRGLITYNLYEPNIERLQSPAIPYARCMLGARTIHEWCHLAVDAGWVPLRVAQNDFLGRVETTARLLDDAVTSAPLATRNRTAPDLQALNAAGIENDEVSGLTRDLPPSAGLSLARIILRRLPDYRANLLAQRFLGTAERETYVRQNIRELRSDYPAEQLWRMLARFLYEYQYLEFSLIEDREEYFLKSTWFDNDFIASGIMDRVTFGTLTETVGAICHAFAVDESKFRATREPDAVPVEVRRHDPRPA